MTKKTDDTTGREIIQTRVFDAPRELVFDAWTKAEHLARWFGPAGFTITTSALDFRTGGHWTYVMHGPDGKDWPNYMKFEEVKRAERIVYAHGAFPSEPPHFHVETTFTSEGAGKTRLTMRSVFPTADALEAVKRFGAVEGGRQTMQRLADFLASEQGAYTTWRKIEAPQALVFKAFTEADRLSQWWGPKGCTTRSIKLDLRVGGLHHYAFKFDGKGDEMHGLFEFEEVTPSERLVFTNGFCDAQGTKTPTPFEGDWPERIQNVVTMTAVGNLTILTLVARPVAATDAQRRTFEAQRTSLDQGYNGSFDVLVDYLKKAR